MDFLKDYFRYEDVSEEKMKKIVNDFKDLDRTEFKNHMSKNYNEYL